MTGPVDRATIDRLAARIKQLEDAVRKANRTPQLKSSSIDDGALTIKSDGQVTAIVGQQYDGTAGAVVVAGPTPPVPSGLSMETVTSGVRIELDGSFVQTTADRAAGRPTVAPQDFERFEVRVSDDVDFPDATTRAGLYIGSAAGGYTFAPWAAGTALYAQARTWSKAGKASAWSLITGPVEAGKVGVADLGFDISSLAGTHVFYGATDPTADPGSSVSYGDLWLKEVDPGSPPATPPQYESWRWTPAEGTDPDRWVQLADQGATGALEAAVTAQEAADAKATLFTQSSAPTWSGAAGTAYWVDTGHGNRPMIWTGSAWTAYQLGNGAIAPNSLVASDVVATGTVSASLLQAILVLVTAIIAGDPNGTHAAMKPDGLHIYDENGNEVIRLGTTTGDYFGIVTSVGQLLASVDSTGAINARTGNFREDVVVAGTSLAELLRPMMNSGQRNLLVAGGGQTNYGWADASINGVTTEIGLVDVAVNVVAGRQYLLGYDLSAKRHANGGGEAELRVRIRDGGVGGSPTISSPQIVYRQHSDSHLDWDASFQRWQVWIPSTTGVHRLLLTVSATDGVAGTVDVTALNALSAIYCIDNGTTAPQSAQVNRGGGTTTPPAYQRYVDIGFDNHATYRGNGTQRTDTSDVVQGWDPSGFNGDGYGWYGFGGIPAISGTVDRVDLYLYFNHWYYNSGGTAIIAPIAAGDGSNLNALKLKSNWYVGGWPKPGGRWVTVPSDWWPLLRTGGGFYGIGLGPSGGTDETYYGRASDCRLRIWYTQ